MSESTLMWVWVSAAFVVAGAWAWRRWHRLSFWYVVEFPVKAALVYLSWGSVAYGCKLSVKRRRWRLRFEGVPILGRAARTASSVVIQERRRLRRVDVDRAPRLGVLRPTPLGWRVRVRLLDGQHPDDYAAAAQRLAHAWRVHAVRVQAYKPGKITLLATMRDPLVKVTVPNVSAGLLKVRPGRLENGEVWVIDFRAVPHWLNAGATQSGKSNLANAIIMGLAPQTVALVGLDLKGGVEFTPYRPRLSALATTRPECVDLLDDLVDVVTTRMNLCRTQGVRSIWRLPEPARPVPVVVLIDEVAELFLMADKREKEEVSKTATALLRLAQLGRAFGVYLFICGQRIGSDLGPGVTALRSQLSGRICHRVNDPETATMTLGDLDPAALDAARAIPAHTPGVAVVAGDDGSWHRARSLLVTEKQAEHSARINAHRAPSWPDITRTVVPVLLPHQDEDQDGDQDDTPAAA